MRTVFDSAQSLVRQPPAPFRDISLSIMIRAYREVLFLPRPVWMLFWAGVINRICHMVLPFLALYSHKVLGLTEAEAGLIVTLYGVGALFSGLVAGWLCDRVGAIHVMIACLSISALLQVLLSAFTNVYLFAGVVVLFSLACECFRPSLLTLASQYGPPALQRQTFALVRLSVNLGMSIGPALGGVLFVYSPRLLFWFNAAASFCAALLMWGALRRGIFSAKSEAATEEINLWQSLMLAYSDRRLMWLLVGLMPAMIVLFQHESSLALILVRDLGMNETDYGTIFTVNTFLIISLEIWLTSQTVRYASGKVMALGSLFVGVGFSLLYWVRNPLELNLMTVVWTIGEMLVFPVAVTYVSHVSSPKTRGSFMAAYGVMISLCLILAPALGTSIWQSFGLGAFSVLCATLGLLSFGMLWKVK